MTATMMVESLPFYFQWNLSQTPIKKLHDLLDKFPFGKRPVLLTLEEDDLAAQERLQIVERYLREATINPQFPYPTYLLSEHPLTSEWVNILEDKSLLPEYFHFRPKELTSQENELLCQVKILAEKIRNIASQGQLQDFTKNKHETRRAFMISRETQFYEDILSLHNKEASRVRA